MAMIAPESSLLELSIFSIHLDLTYMPFPLCAET